MTVTLADSGLVATGFTGATVPFFSDPVEFWNRTTQRYDAFWYRTDTAQWVNFNPAEPVRDIEPGDGFWVNVLVFNTPFTWTYPRS